MAPDLAPNCFNVCHQKRLAGKVSHVYNPVKCTEYEMYPFFRDKVKCELRAASCKLRVAKANFISQHILTIIFNT